MKTIHRQFSGVLFVLILSFLFVLVVSIPAQSAATNEFETMLSVAPAGGVMTIEVHREQEFRDALDIFTCTNLISREWALLANAGSSDATVVLADTNASGRIAGFYAVASAEDDLDGDTLSDARETLLHQTDPADSDTDSDDMPDGWEVKNGLSPLLSDDALLDLDGDGWNNHDEFLRGSSAGVFTQADIKDLIKLCLETPMEEP